MNFHTKAAEMKAQQQWITRSSAESAMRVVAADIAEARVNIVYHKDDKQGVYAVMETNTLHIPTLAYASGITLDQLMIFRAFIAHESGHLLFSRFQRPENKNKTIEDVYQRIAKGRNRMVLHNIVNAMEDNRMEGLMRDRFPGAMISLNYLRDHCNGKLNAEIPAFDADKRKAAIVWEAMCAMGLQMDGAKPLWDLQPKSAAIVKKAWAKYSTCRNCKDIDSVMELAVEVYDLITDERENDQQMKSPMSLPINGPARSSQSQQSMQQTQQQKQQKKDEEKQKQQEQQKKEQQKKDEQSKSKANGNSKPDEQSGENGEGSDSEGTESSKSGKKEKTDKKNGKGDKQEKTDKSDKGSKGEDKSKKEKAKNDKDAPDEAGKNNESGDEAEDEGDGEGDDQSDNNESGNEEGENGKPELDENGEPVKPEESDDGELEIFVGIEGDVKEQMQAEVVKAIAQVIRSRGGRPSGPHSPEEFVYQGVDYTSFCDGDEHVFPEDDMRDYAANAINNVRKDLDTSLNDLILCLEQNLRALTTCKTSYYQPSGDINFDQLTDIAKHLSEDVFTETAIGIKLDTAVEIVIDQSGSMGGNGIHNAQLTAIALGEALTRIGIPFEIHGTTANRKSTPRQAIGSFTRYAPLTFFHYVLFNESWEDVNWKLGTMNSYDNNLDGEAIDYCVSRLMERPEARKIVISISDGLPYSGQPNNRELTSHLVDACKVARAKGVEVYGFGVATNEPAKYYGQEYFINIVNPQEMGFDVTERLSEILLTGLERR